MSTYQGTSNDLKDLAARYDFLLGAMRQASVEHSALRGLHQLLTVTNEALEYEAGVLEECMNLAGDDSHRGTLARLERIISEYKALEGSIGAGVPGDYDTWGRLNGELRGIAARLEGEPQAEPMTAPEAPECFTMTPGLRFALKGCFGSCATCREPKAKEVHHAYETAQ